MRRKIYTHNSHKSKRIAFVGGGEVFLCVVADNQDLRDMLPSVWRQLPTDIHIYFWFAWNVWRGRSLDGQSWERADCRERDHNGQLIYRSVK